jgi:mannose-1-phosphate guanylyltransferase
MFIWRADTILAAFERHLPDLHAAFLPLAEPGSPRSRPSAEAFQRSPKISIDYGVMERAAPKATSTSCRGRSGGATWATGGRSTTSLRQDQAGNAVEGNVILHDTGRCYVRSEGRLVVLVGARDLAVVDTRTPSWCATSTPPSR